MHASGSMPSSCSGRRCDYTARNTSAWLTQRQQLTCQLHGVPQVALLQNTDRHHIHKHGRRITATFYLCILCKQFDNWNMIVSIKTSKWTAAKRRHFNYIGQHRNN